jgi:hypothetical protein
MDLRMSSIGNLPFSDFCRADIIPVAFPSGFAPLNVNRSPWNSSLLIQILFPSPYTYFVLNFIAVSILHIDVTHIKTIFIMSMDTTYMFDNIPNKFWVAESLMYASAIVRFFFWRNREPNEVTSKLLKYKINFDYKQIINCYLMIDVLCCLIMCIWCIKIGIVLVLQIIILYSISKYAIMWPSCNIFAYPSALAFLWEHESNCILKDL